MKYLFRLLAVLVLAMTLFTPTASADTVLFSFETIQLQQALADAISSKVDPNLYAFFDIRMQPVSLQLDGIVQSMPGYTIGEVISPSPFDSGVDEWTANVETFDGAAFVHFALNFGDSLYPLVSTNDLGSAVATGPAPYLGKVLEQMAAGRTWGITLTTDAPVLAESSISFKVLASGVKVNESGTTVYAGKPLTPTAFMELSPEPVPEATTCLLAGCGLALLLFAQSRKPA